MSFSKPEEGNIFQKFSGRYAKSIRERPVLTKALTSGFIAGLGNLLSQLIARGDDPLKWRSILAFAITGSTFVGPVIHYFFIWLDQLIPRKEKYSLLKKIILDRIVFAPPFLVIYFFMIALLEGQSFTEAFIRIYQFFWPMLKMNWKVWTPMQLINFTFVPHQYRVLFGNLVSLFWTMYVAATRN